MPRDREYLLDILEAARLARSYVSDMTMEAFLDDVQCQDAVIRRLEIIGEAARRVTAWPVPQGRSNGQRPAVGSRPSSSTSVSDGFPSSTTAR
ncbi:MAG: DUF86 domain-containing protein [Planctomycetota bacterium]